MPEESNRALLPQYLQHPFYPGKPVITNHPQVHRPEGCGIKPWKTDPDTWHPSSQGSHRPWARRL